MGPTPTEPKESYRVYSKGIGGMNLGEASTILTIIVSLFDHQEL